MKNCKKKESSHIVEKEKHKSILTERKRKALLIVMVLFSFLLIYLLNCNTGLIADDYDLSFIIGTNYQRLTNIREIGYSVSHLYLYSNGRIVAHSFAQFFLMFDKAIFNVCNSIVYVLFIMLLCFHIFGKVKITIQAYLASFLAMWFFQPVFGQTVIWLDGSCNYLWTTTLILLFLLPYRIKFQIYYESHCVKTLFVSVFMLILGVIAGCTNENSAGGMLILTFAFIYFHFKAGNQRIWMGSGAVGALLGFLFMLHAPGYKQRLAADKMPKDLWSILLVSVKNVLETAWHYLLIPTCLLILLGVIYYFSKKRMKGDADVKTLTCYVFAGYCTHFAMLLTPEFPQRSEFAVIVFLIIGSGILLTKIDWSDYPLKQMASVALVLTTIVFCGKYSLVYQDTKSIFLQRNERFEYVMSEKQKGNAGIHVNTIMSVSPYGPTYQNADLWPEADYWSNRSFAHYYGIKSITGTDYEPDNLYWGYH